MSVRWISKVWDSGREWSGSVLLVMLALADYANDDGYFWPSITSIAKKCRLSERQAQRIIRALVAEGAIEVAKHGDGRGHTTFYRIKDVMGDTLFEGKDDIDDTPLPGKGDIQREKANIQREVAALKRVTSSAERVTSSARKGDIAMSPDPLVNPSLEPSVKTTTNSIGSNEPTQLNSTHAPLAENPPMEVEPTATAELSWVEFYAQNPELKDLTVQLLKDPDVGLMDEKVEAVLEKRSPNEIIHFFATWWQDRLYTKLGDKPITPGLLAWRLTSPNSKHQPSRISDECADSPPYRRYYASLEVMADPPDWFYKLPKPGAGLRMDGYLDSAFAELIIH